MAKQGNANQIGEANVRITGDISDLKAKVAEANRETEKIGKGGRRGRGRSGGTDGGDRDGGIGTDEFRGFRRAIGITAFITGVGAAFFKLGQQLREIVTREKAYTDALHDRSQALRLSAEEESKILEKKVEDINNEIERIYDGNLFHRLRQELVQFVQGRPESVLEELLQDLDKQRGEVATRQASERTRAELVKMNALNQRILDALEGFREQQRQATDRALAQQQVSTARLEQIIGIRANTQRR